MAPMDRAEEIIGLNGAAAVLDLPPEAVRRFAEEGRLRPEGGDEGGYVFLLVDVLGLARELGAETAEEEIFEGEVMGEEPAGNSRLPAVPFERYERLLQQGQDYKTRLEERTRQIDEIRQERDAARMEIDRLWSEIERLNLVEFQRELQEKTISTLEEERASLQSERERLLQEQRDLTEEKSALSEDRVRLEAELNTLKNRGFWSRLFGGGEKRAMSLAIETEKLTKAYGRKARGIEDVDLAVEEGEVFGFLGPNGAGKTTTVRTLLGFLRPTSGRGEVFGLDIRRESVEIRARVGNLPGEFALEDKMTGEGLLKYFARLRGVGDLGYAHEVSERLGAELHRPMRRLSRGNKQKIGLVQAMFHKPPLLILDEPTGGLDPLVQEEFLDIIEEVKAEGRTVFFSSHNLAEVERVCDRVGIIRGGRLAAVETTETLVDKSFRHVVLTFAEDVDPKPFEALSGVKDLRAGGNRLAFTLYDDLDEMVKLAAGHELVNMEYERPSLEEVFLTYYERENGEAR